MRYLFVGLLAVLLAGCSTLGPYPAPQPTPPATAPEEPDDMSREQPSGRDIEPVTRPASLSRGAVTELLEQAWQLHRFGNFQRSIAVAERALRLDRYESNVYLILAANHVATENFQLAEHLIRQGLPLVGEDRQQEGRFMLLLREVEKARTVGK